MKKNIALCLCALVILSACTAQSDPPSTGGGRLNVVEALGLKESVRLEIMEFDQDDVDPLNDYIPVSNITNLEKVEEIIFLLDSDLKEAPALLCIPEYRLRFWLEDGSQVDLSFSCQDANFLTGEQVVFAGRQFSPPGKFTALIESYLGQPAQIPVSINLLKAAQFSEVVRIEIFNQNLAEDSAEVNSIRVIDDFEIIEQVLLAMSGEYPLAERARCPVDYFISFTMDDDRTVTFGFMCPGDENGILRGDQEYFFDRDIHLGGDFSALFESLIDS